MGERGSGPARYAFVSTGSNTNVKATPGVLYRVISSNPAGSVVRIEDGDMGTTPNFNSSDSDTIAVSAGPVIDFGPGVGFNSKLIVAATSNARVTVVYE